jgi:hypothetical protein
MEREKVNAKTLGVVRRGPLALHATWEILPVRMLRLLVEIEEAEKRRSSHYIIPPKSASSPDDRTDD